MTLPEGTDASAIFPKLKKATYSLNQTHESDLDKPTMMAAIIAAIGINTKLRRFTMMATEWKPYESYVVLRRLCGLLPLPDITSDFVL